MDQEQIHEDGWDKEEEDIIFYEQTQSCIRYKGQKALALLEPNHYSLQPDMFNGWRPKLPCCPLPLSYQNPYTDAIIDHLSRESLYSIVYRGPRYTNSIQVNQQNNYFWRYRDRYNHEIGQQSIKKIISNNPFGINSSSSNHKFSSAFESGNLDLAIRVNKNEYDCFLRSDTNTKGHTNWYYFKVTNKEGGTMKINISNMTKCRNLYTKGMKPYVKVGSDGKWSQEYCSDVVFVERYCRYLDDRKNYQLQFTYLFTQTNQEVYFAYAIPYTYSDLQNFVKQIKCLHPSLVNTRRLCQTLGGVQIPLLTITSPQKNQQNQNPSTKPQASSESKKKKVIVITSRIHPGQTNSSHMIEGLVRQLLCDTEGSNVLRSMFLFYIVPMMNPDGVIAGNFRTSYSGKDLNRQFNKLNKYIFPEITALSEFCEGVKKFSNQSIQFYFDFHGHSAKKNLFCYGPEHSTTKSYFFKSRALAKIIEKISPIFSYRKSIFTISQKKKNTGRAFMLRNMKIPMTFTFQISNGLYEDQNKNDVYLNHSILLQTGEIVLKGLYRYAQLQMTIPKKSIKAKVDSGKEKKRPLNSAGSRRAQALKKRLKIETSEGFRMKTNKSIQKVQYSLQQNAAEDHQQFINLIREIKEQEHELNKQAQIEGGSDSESSADDFDKEQTNQLFNQILKRTSAPNSNFLIKEKKKSKVLQKITNSKKKTQQEQYFTKAESVLENRKTKSNLIIDISRPPVSSIKNIKRGFSQQYERVVLTQKNFTLFL